MDDVTPVNIVFDYTNFLGECSDHHWTFVEVFGLHWFSDNDKAKDVGQKLWESAMHKMSTQHSDEDNIIELIRLAKKLNIATLKLIMPYELPRDQVQKIEDQSQVRLDSTRPEEFVVQLSESLPT